MQTGILSRFLQRSHFKQNIRVPAASTLRKLQGFKSVGDNTKFDVSKLAQLLYFKTCNWSKELTIIYFCSRYTVKLKIVISYLKYMYFIQLAPMDSFRRWTDTTLDWSNYLFGWRKRLIQTRQSQQTWISTKVQHYIWVFISDCSFPCNCFTVSLNNK